ncbi:MAG: ABC transporter permease, partial [Longimicrobiales bacterium]
MREELRYALRLPRRHAGFAAAIVLTLGLGIGAATSIFTVVDSLVLRSLPFEDPDELVALGTGSGEYASPFVDPEAAAVWRARDDVFADVRAYRYQSVTIMAQGEPRFKSSARLEPGFLSMLGISPIVGRGFLPEESVPGRDRVVMLGESLWRATYDADRSVPGRIVTIDGVAHTVVGVLPAALRMVPTGRVELVTPLDTRTLAAEAGVSMIGRLRRDVGIDAAENRLRGLAGTLSAERPREQGWSVRLTLLDDTRTRGVREGMTLLASAVALLLLIACANAAGLVVVRNAGRRHEFAVRAALGCGRLALFRQLLCESAVLALMAGGLGVLLGFAGLRGLLAIVPASILEYSYTTVRMDGRVLAFAVLATTATGVLFGAAPAFQSARLSSALATASRGTTASHTQRRFRSGLVVLELALAVVLLAAAGLLANSFARLMMVEPGVDAD